jgi:methyl-accepting chemotaxis protein
MKVATKLGLGFGAVLLVLIFVITIGYYNMSKFSQANSWNIHTYEVMEEGGGMLTNMINMETGIRGYVVSGNENFLEPYNNGRKAFIEHFDKAKSLTSDNSNQQDRLAKILELHKEFSSVAETLIKLRKESVEGSRSMDSVIVFFREARDKKSMDAFRALESEFEKTESTLLVKRSEESASLESTTKLTLIVGGIIGVLLSSIIGFLIVSNLMKQLGGEPDYVSEIARRISAGDLTMSVAAKKGDSQSIVASMKEMQEKLKKMVSEVQSNSDQVLRTATEVATASNQVAEGSRLQSEAASSMAASVEEMTVSIDQVSSNAEEAKAASIYSGELSKQGAEVIQSAASEMVHIESSVKGSAKVIEGLQQQADGITTIVNVIKEIADQTNLLALNAAIEAARAGEQGRGFAVVADEVRKLAERTGNSTREISTMIGNIQGATRETVSSMEVGANKVTGGVTLANQAGQSIQQIQTEANRVVQVITDIADSLKEQSAASRDIAVNVERIAQMSEENSAAVQNTSSAANKLEELALSLQATIGRFKV